MLIALILTAVTLCYFTTHLFAVVKAVVKANVASKTEKFDEKRR